MIIVLPLLLMLFVVGALRGGTTLILLLPMLLMLAVGVVYVAIAMRDGTEKRRRTEDPSIRTLPTTFLGRQMHSALRPPRPKRSSSSRSPWKGEKGAIRSAPRRRPT
jgi:hypothetical protein